MIQYFDGGRFRPGKQNEEDNPMSPAFTPLRKRTPNSQARWWALTAQKRREGQSAEMTFEKTIDSEQEGWYKPA